MPRWQKGKDRKRWKGWHRGRSEEERWLEVELPDVGSGADVTQPDYVPLARNGTLKGKRKPK